MYNERLGRFPMKLCKGMEKREWIWLFIASLLVLLFSSLPYAVASSRQNAQWTFGGAVLNRPDYSVYIADIQSGLRGITFYPMLHSPEEANPVYLRLFYVWVGLLGRGTSLPAPVLFHLARWICGAAALVAMYLLAAQFFRSVGLRRFAWLVFVFGSGFGWLMVIFNLLPASGIAPADFSQIELYGFLTILLSPHFALTEALLWATALAFLNGWSESRHRNAWLAFGLILAVASQSIQLFAPLTLDIAMAGYGLWRWVNRRRIDRREAVSLLLLALVQLPWVVYSLWVFQTDPIWGSYFQQNRVLSPPVIDHLLGLGALAFFIVLGLGVALRRRRAGRWHLMALWIVTIAVASYFPSSFSRRFVAGGMGPIALLVTLGIVAGLWPWVRRMIRGPIRRRYFVRMSMYGAILLFVSQSTLWFTGGMTAVLSSRDPTFFDTADELEAMRWLEANADWQDPVFASDWTGNRIPAAIGHRVYAGHWAESTDYEDKLTRIDRFFRPQTMEIDRYSIIRDSGCRYVFYGPREREIGDADLDQAPFLRLVFHNATVRVYEVVPWEGNFSGQEQNGVGFLFIERRLGMVPSDAGGRALAG